VFGSATYLIYLAAWAAPVVALQWLAGGPELRARWRPLAAAACLATLYLAAADRFALDSGIWTISPTRSIGVDVLGLPLEELMFFGLTNLMVVQSVALLTTPGMSAGRVLRRLREHVAGLTVVSRAWHVGLAAASVTSIIASTASLVLGAAPALSAPAALVMEATPVPTATWLLTTLGEWSRPLALLGAFAIYLAVGALIGALATAGPLGLALALYAAGVWLVVSAFGTHPLAATILAVGPLAPVAARAALAHRRWTGGSAGRDGSAPISDAEAVERRSALGSTVPPGRAIGRSRRRLLRLAPLLTAPALLGLWLADRRVRDLADPAERLFIAPAPAPRVAGFPVDGQSPEVTPLASFYVVSKNVEDPAPDPATWRLRVRGEVARPLTLDLADLRALPRVDLYATLQCVSNPIGGPLMGNGLWSGARLADLLAQAEPRDAARWFVCRGVDGHEEDLPMAVALAPDTLIAYALDGRALERRHGFPARLLVPGRYGFKNVKWLAEVELVARETPGHWPSRGWTREAPMRTSARVDAVHREANGLLAAGIAIAGARSISRVEARVAPASGAPGAWVAAELNRPPLGPAAWVQWRARLPLPEAASGRVEARAFDGLGEPQILEPRAQFPDGATGLHARPVPD